MAAATRQPMLNPSVPMSIPVPIPSVTNSVRRHQLLSCSLESALSASQVPALALPKHWGRSPIDSPPNTSLLTGRVAQPDASVPPAEPPYISKTWSLRCHEEPNTIMEAVRDALDKLDVDTDDNEARWHIEGSAYVANSSARFAISLFAFNGITYTLELQRRGGDPFAFREFFNAFLALFGKVLSTTPLCSQAPSVQALPLPGPEAGGSRSSSAVMTSTSLNCLLSMASSEYIDVRREALQSLARVCHLDEWKQTIASSSAALHMLRVTLLTSDTELVRCSSSVITELSSTDMGRSAILRSGVLEPILSLIESPVAPIARQAADTLARVSKTHCCRIQLSQQQARLIQRCRAAAPDQRVRELVTSAVERLEEFGSLPFSPSSTSSIFGECVPLSV